MAPAPTLLASITHPTNNHAIADVGISAFSAATPRRSSDQRRSNAALWPEGRTLVGLAVQVHCSMRGALDAQYGRAQVDRSIPQNGPDRFRELD